MTQFFRWVRKSLNKMWIKLEKVQLPYTDNSDNPFADEDCEDDSENYDEKDEESL